MTTATTPRRAYWCTSSSPNHCPGGWAERATLTGEAAPKRRGPARAISCPDYTAALPHPTTRHDLCVDGLHVRYYRKRDPRRAVPEFNPGGYVDGPWGQFVDDCGLGFIPSPGGWLR